MRRPKSQSLGPRVDVAAPQHAGMIDSGDMRDHEGERDEFGSAASIANLSKARQRFIGKPAGETKMAVHILRALIPPEEPRMRNTASHAEGGRDGVSPSPAVSRQPSRRSPRQPPAWRMCAPRLVPVLPLPIEGNRPVRTFSAD